MHSEATGKRREAEAHAQERIELDPVAGRGGRVEEGDLLGALPVAWCGLGGVQRWCGFELKLGASIYRRIDGVAVNGESPASNYGEAVDWQWY